jgi:hypothetical protein
MGAPGKCAGPDSRDSWRVQREQMPIVEQGARPVEKIPVINPGWPFRADWSRSSGWSDGRRDQTPVYGVCCLGCADLFILLNQRKLELLCCLITG